MIDPFGVLRTGTPAEVEAEVRRQLDAAAGVPFILGTQDGTLPGTPEANIRGDWCARGPRVEADDVTGRERIVAVLEGRLPDRVPWSPQLTRTFFLGIREYAERFRSPDLPGPIDHYLVPDELAWRVAWYRARGAAFQDWLPPGTTARHERCRRTERVVGDRLLVELATPVGTLTAELAATSEAGSYHPVKLLIDGPDDLRVFAYAVKDTIVRGSARRDAAAARRSSASAGVALMNGPSAPLQRLLLGDLGIEGSLLALADHPREMASLMSAMHESGLAQCPGAGRDPRAGRGHRQRHRHGHAVARAVPAARRAVRRGIRRDPPRGGQAPGEPRERRAGRADRGPGPRDGGRRGPRAGPRKRRSGGAGRGMVRGTAAGSTLAPPRGAACRRRSSPAPRRRRRPAPRPS